MNDGVIQGIGGERDQVLDVERLIEAVRGSRAARVLFEYRLCHSQYVEQDVVETSIGFCSPAESQHFG